MILFFFSIIKTYLHWFKSTVSLVFHLHFLIIQMVWFGFMVFNRVPGENHRPAASRWQILSHNVVHFALSWIQTNNVSRDRHRCIGSYKSNYHTITATTAPSSFRSCNLLNMGTMSRDTIPNTTIYMIYNK